MCLYVNIELLIVIVSRWIKRDHVQNYHLFSLTIVWMYVARARVCIAA